MTHYDEGAYWFDHDGSSKSYLFSVRCVQDEE